MRSPKTQSVNAFAEIAASDRAVIEAAMPEIYQQLRRLAAAHLRAERSGHTLQPTALVNEAFIRLQGSNGRSVVGRLHFFRLASKLMRQILVDHARTRQRHKRGSGLGRVTLVDAVDKAEPIDLLELDDALQKLEVLDAAKARLVELRFFAGMKEEDAAEVLEISRTQAAREWRTTRAWLADELSDQGRT